MQQRTEDQERLNGPGTQLLTAVERVMTERLAAGQSKAARVRRVQDRIRAIHRYVQCRQADVLQSQLLSVGGSAKCGLWLDSLILMQVAWKL